MSTQQLVVVGGGPAGCSAAIEAAQRGLQVTLIDEHPQPVAAMALDAPYFYGSRLDSALSDASAIADRVLGANDLLLQCFDAGVDVVTGACVWGNYVPGPNSTSTRECRLGLADAERSWMLTYEHLILAPGARDLVLSFPGWHLPGVMGVAGASALLGRYQAFGGNRVIVLGSGNAALLFATRCIERGIEIAGVVDVAEQVRGDAQLSVDLQAKGIPFYLSSVIGSAVGSASVESVQLRRVGPGTQVTDDDVTHIPCDSVCMAFGLVPNIELAAQSGCALEYSAARSGWVPKVTADMRTSIANIYAVGDGTGVTEAMIRDSAIAVAQGHAAAIAVSGGNGSEGHGRAELNVEPPGSAPRQWLTALRSAAGDDVVVCQCESVTRADLLETREPRYLANKIGGALSIAGRRSQDLAKRLTRAGMGHCQGKRCRDQVGMLLSTREELEVSQITPGTYRPPLRPLPLTVLADHEETEEARAVWPTWFQPLNEGEIG